MRPILYEKTETQFTGGGIGRLVDCIECKVTEELNTGVYECDFQYPVTGELYSEITLGRIIGVTHDDTGDLQPFDIVSCSKPIDGVVSFHAVHISYRLTRYIAVPQYSVDDVGDAWTLFDNAYPQLIAGRFHFSAPGWTPPTAPMTAINDGLPRSVREYIGGVEGGLLDTYGGEILWDKFDVKLLSQRGQARDLVIRYGVNMMDYKEEQDGQETYTLAIPFWKGQGNLVVGGLVDSGLTPYDRQLCVAMDLTDKFETEPTTAQLEAEALSIMTSGQPNLPRRTIEVDFVRLQDLEDYGDYSDLATCELGDSISVVFPTYNIQGTFRIVKVIWDALRDRFDTMTLGSLQTMLAEALGVGGGGMTNVGGGGGGGSVVSFQQVLSSGERIGIITIDGTPTDIYAPSGGGGSKNVWYGDCSTASNTDAKTVSTANADFVKAAGNIVYVYFTNSDDNTGNPKTLNVDGTGAETIYMTNLYLLGGTAWSAGEVVGFVYDGTRYMMIDAGMATTTTLGVTSLSSSTSSSSETKAATPKAVKAAYDLADSKAKVIAKTATLWHTGWTSNTQSVVVAGVTASNIVLVTYDPADRAAWIAADIYCSGQSLAGLTFTCSTTPTSNLTANILIID